MCAVIVICGEPHFTSSSCPDVDQESPREDPCPDEAAIAPCTCWFAEDDPTYIIMNCSNVETEEQLENAFLADFPTREFTTFTMQRNDLLTRLGNVLHGTTFRFIDLWSVAVDVITDDCFIASADTLESFVLDGSQVNTTHFPFHTIESYSKLTYLDVSSSKLNFFPLTLTSNSLTDLRLNANLMTGTVPAAPFNNMPNLTYFQIFLNQLTEIESGAFSSLPLLKSVSFFQNMVTVLRAGTFVVSTNASIEILANEITTVEPGAITKVSSDLNVYISLGANRLPEILEDVWGELLAYNTSYLVLSSNPLLCGCDIAWLILNPMYLGQMDNYTACVDGRLLIDLDPALYLNC